jgi:NADPH:quinone reductase-like Zn-dependent oxidoreductase
MIRASCNVFRRRTTMSASRVPRFLFLFLAVAVSARAELPEMTRNVIYQKTDGGYRLQLVEAPVPRPEAGQVLVRMRAVSLNRGEIENMAQSGGRDRSGMIAASDGAGVVVALGAGTKEFKVGDRVTSMYFNDYTHYPPKPENLRGAIGSNMDGVFGEYVVLDETALVPIPAGWSDVDAATLPTAGLTAWSAVMIQGRVGPRKIVLVQGTGGVSTFALQIAKAAGATVIVTSSSEEKLGRARALGADHTINYRTTPEWGKRVLELTGGRGADLVVEVGGQGTLKQSLEALALNGTISIIGGITGYGGELPAVGVLDKAAHVVGILVGSRNQLKDFQAFLIRNNVKPVIEHVFSLLELDAAINQLRSGQFVGKIVVTL